jgi:hypothetical protein
MAIREGYKLEFNWKGIRYEGNIAYFESAFFTGPVLQRMAKVEGEDFIDLDFTEQNMRSGIFLPKYYYIARLKWRAAVYSKLGIELTECTLDHHKTGSLKTLKDGMKFNIDCSKHEHTTHNKFLVYPAWVVNEHGEELT